MDRPKFNRKLEINKNTWINESETIVNISLSKNLKIKNL